MANRTKRTACGRAIQHFFQTTTLHGFKYLCSKYNTDRIGWLICCCASACCAGVLCAVLWARFLEVPALLTLHDLRSQQNAVELPLVAICPPAETVADLFQEKLIINASATNRLKTILKYVLRRKVTSMEQLIILEDILIGNNLTLPQALMRVMPPCSRIVKNCRLQSSMVPCRNLFNRELTEWGVCCILRPEKLKISKTTIFQVQQNRNLDIAVQCSEKQSLDGCDVS
ncbi:unnamed protein product [Euphydryas editha]|uniref:Uncharacterized protein n=1 Tax=Euphydryas editha TaxID=104508 RepID=A0AAU9U1J1_EUPED|nr:unnamed protein product [Euphydryas editha]